MKTNELACLEVDFPASATQISLEPAGSDTSLSSKAAASHSRSTQGVTVGILVDLSPEGLPIVELSYPTGEKPQRTMARSTVSLQPGQVGSQVVVVFEDQDQLKPIVLGCLCRSPVQASSVEHASVPDGRLLNAKVDGEQLVIDAEKEVVLRCGKASITLTRAGKVLIRGEYVLSRSTGVHRIQGGSVQIN